MNKTIKKKPRIAVLSSGRMDFSYYIPLLKALKKKHYPLDIIAFGTHTSTQHGDTKNCFQEEGFDVSFTADTLTGGDTPHDINLNMAKSISKISEIWNNSRPDLVLCLGDRYEMFAAVTSTVPHNLKVAHFHGGETTLGAIDNVFRHAISCMSTYHFTSTHTHKKRVCDILGTHTHVYNVGALSLDNLNTIKLYNIKQFQATFNIDLSPPTLLCTFHPETTELDDTLNNLNILLKSLDKSKFQVLITCPNSDTLGNKMTEAIHAFTKNKNKFHSVQSLGLRGYYSAIALCKAVIGNSSSGIIETASFSKYAINLGNRQKGRDAGPNVLHTSLSETSILETIRSLDSLPPLTTNNIYGNGTTTQKIMEILGRL